MRFAIFLGAFCSLLIVPERACACKKNYYYDCDNPARCVRARICGSVFDRYGEGCATLFVRYGYGNVACLRTVKSADHAIRYGNELVVRTVAFAVLIISCAYLKARKVNGFANLIRSLVGVLSVNRIRLIRFR